RSCLTEVTMLRHRLAPLFDPACVLVVSERELPVMRAPPQAMQSAFTSVRVKAGEPAVVPDNLHGLAPGQRLDLVVICVSPPQLHDTLQAIRPHRPRLLVLLSSEQVPDDSYEMLAYCRSWGQFNDCQVLGPRSFGIQLPELQLNLSHAPQLAAVGRVALVAQSSSLVAALLD